MAIIHKQSQKKVFHEQDIPGFPKSMRISKVSSRGIVPTHGLKEYALKKSTIKFTHRTILCIICILYVLYIVFYISVCVDGHLYAGCITGGGK